MKNQILIAVVSVIAVFGLLGLVYVFVNKPEVYPEINKIKANDHIKWSSSKKNVLVEYSDFFCPACKVFHDYLNQFETTSSSEFKITQSTTLVFRHFPIHEDLSFNAAYAAEAAGLQGKFYPMVDLIFKNQENLQKSADIKNALQKLAEELKLNIDQFKKDFNSQVVKEKVSADQASGDKAGINATPTFFLNGKKLQFNSVDEFIKIINNS